MAQDGLESIGLAEKPEIIRVRTIGGALGVVAQQEVAESLEILREMMDIEGKHTKQITLSYCRAVTGWIEGGPGEINVIPGAAADAAELDRVIDTLNAISNSKEVDKWTCDWYGYQFQLPQHRAARFLWRRWISVMSLPLQFQTTRSSYTVGQYEMMTEGSMMMSLGRHFGGP